MNEEYYIYLDKLRDSGVTNMYFAGPYLARDFGLPEKECQRIVWEWMKTFAKRHPNEVKAKL